MIRPRTMLASLTAHAISITASITASVAVGAAVPVAVLVSGCDRSGANAPTAAEASTPSTAAPSTPAANAAPSVPAAANDAPPAPKPVVAVQYAQAGGMHYLERLVGGAQPDATLPMIVAIHGLGDRPEAFAGVLENFPQPARVILPRGLEAYEGGWSWFPGRARDRDVEGLSQGIGHAADVIAKGLAALVDEKPTLGKPIVTGFSQGGMLSFTLAIHHPDVVSAAVPVGGWLPPPLWPKQGPGAGQTFPEVNALHGTADNAVFYLPTAAAVDHLSGLGYDVTLTSFEGVRHAMPAEIRRALADQLTDACGALAKQRPSAARAGVP